MPKCNDANSGISCGLKGMSNDEDTQGVDVQLWDNFGFGGSMSGLSHFLALVNTTGINLIRI